jgi:hypothetical protein
MSAVEGRWTVYVCTGCEMPTGRHKDCDAAREATPVVPVDDAAVERAEVAAAKILAPYSKELTPDIVAQQIVEAVLRAAGETP